MILVTGATGNLGAHLMLKLLKNNDQIIAIKRESSNLENIKKIFSYYTNQIDELFNKIIWINTDIQDYVGLDDAFENIDIVYHCAAYVSLDNVDYKKSYSTNVEGTSNIVNLCIKHNVKKLCHVSSIAAIGLNDEKLTSEEDMLNPEEITSFYSLTKYYGELEVWRGIEEGLNAVIVNPSVILAPYILNKKTNFLINYFIKKHINYFTIGKKGYIDVNDLTEIMILLTQSEISKQRFIISAENLSFKEIIDIINSHFNHKNSNKEISKFKLNFLRFILSIFTFGSSPLSKQIIHYLLTDDIYTNEKLQKVIDFQFTPINKTIDNIINLFLKE